MSRKDELLNLVNKESRELVIDVIDEIVHLESELDKLKKLPFIRVNPDNPEQQKPTVAAKQYKDFLQQYINCIKLVENVIYKDKRLEDREDEEESPLRKWVKSRNVN